ncbi:unnamed protein product [Arabidopsis halleri]
MVRGVHRILRLRKFQSTAFSSSYPISWKRLFKDSPEVFSENSEEVLGLYEPESSATQLGLDSEALKMILFFGLLI